MEGSTPANGYARAFEGVNYETFAKPVESISKQIIQKAFYFGVKLCAVVAKTPQDLMLTLLEHFKEKGWKWRLGAIIAYKYYDE